MNHCPVYQNVGGHSYGWVYPGPIGSILTPMYVGLEKAQELPAASTLCNQCGVVCPVMIPLPDLQRKLRGAGVLPRPAAVERARGAQGLGVRRQEAGALCAGNEDRRPGDEDDRRPRRPHPPAARRRRLDRRPRPAAPAGRTFRELYREREGAMSHSRDAAHPVPRLSRRAESLGTENAFVVLAEVNALAAARASDIVSFCIGQPDFPTPANIQEAAIARDPRRAGTATRRRPASTSCARRSPRDMGARRGLELHARRRRRRRGREAVHRLHDRVGHRLRRRRRGDLPGARVPDLRVADPSPTGRCRCRCTCARRATSPSIRPSSRPRSRRRRGSLILNTPHNPTGGMLRGADLDAIAAILAATRRSGCSPTRSTRGWSTTGAFESLAARPGHAGAHRSSPTARPRPGR